MENSTKDKDDKKEDEVLSDGAEYIDYGNGNFTVEYSDGSRVTVTGDVYMIHYADGTEVTKRFPMYDIKLSDRTNVHVNVEDYKFSIIDKNTKFIEDNLTADIQYKEDLKKVDDFLIKAGYKDGLKTFDEYL